MRRPPRATRTDTLFPDTARFRSRRALHGDKRPSTSSGLRFNPVRGDCASASAVDGVGLPTRPPQMRRPIRLGHHLTANDLRIDLAMQGDPELPLTNPHDALGNPTDVAQLHLARPPRFDIHSLFSCLRKHPTPRKVTHMTVQRNSAPAQLK